MKSNVHKKLTFIDKFARKYYCPHARLNQLRKDKQQARKQMRRIDLIRLLEQDGWRTDP